MANSNDFGCDLYKVVKKENSLISPLSIRTCLALAYEGAQGVTAEELAAALHLEEDALARSLAVSRMTRTIEGVQGVTLSSANALWQQAGLRILEDYQQTVEDVYGAEVKPVNFQGNPGGAIRDINDWVAEETREKITGIVDEGSVDQTTRLVLTNAVYFKGDWMSKFDEALTKKDSFFVPSGRSAEVDMMEQEKMLVPYFENEAIQVLSLPYEGEDVSMTIALPRTPEAMPDLEDSLTGALLDHWRDNMGRKKVDVFMPRFEIEDNYSLVTPFQQLGARTAFSRGADFSGITGSRDLFISDILHKTYGRVDEEGTEMAAVTATVMRCLGIPPPRPVFRADRPFMYFVRENTTGTVLFMGKIGDPSKL